MNSIEFPCFPKLILTKFVRSVRPSIASIIRNHPTDLLLQDANKNAYEKIAILRKHANGYVAALLTLHSSVCVFFLWVFFHEHSRFTGLQGKGKAISLTPLYCFHPLPELERGTFGFRFICNWDSSKLMTLMEKKFVSSLSFKVSKINRFNQN